VKRAFERQFYAMLYSRIIAVNTVTYIQVITIDPSKLEQYGVQERYET